MAGGIVYYLGSLARMGLQKRKFLISESRGWHHSVCFNSNVYGLYACGDAEACFSSFHFYLSMATLFSKKRSNINKNIFRMCL